MSADNNLTDPGSLDPQADAEIFSAVLTPHRSLGPTGFLIFMLVLGGISFVSGMVFLLAGAWPIFGFFGLDVLLVYWAFRINYRAARAYEVVTVTASELKLRKVSHHGRVSEWTLNPLWVRIDRDEHAEFGIERLYLVSRGRRLPIASFLGADEKASFAQALVGRARRGQARADPHGVRLALRAAEIGWAEKPQRPRSGAINGGTHALTRSHSRSRPATRRRRRL